MSAVRPKRYPASLSILHWVMAAVIAAQVGLGFSLAEGPEMAGSASLALHASLGLMIGLTALVRLAIRLTRPMPKQPSGWRGLMWRAEYWALYALMILLPLTGAMAWSDATGGAPIPVFGLFELPRAAGRPASTARRRRAGAGLAAHLSRGAALPDRRPRLFEPDPAGPRLTPVARTGGSIA